MSTGKHLNTEKTNRIPRGLKAERRHHVITNNPSSANPKETLYVRLPRLTENTFYVPGSVYLSADINISGDDANLVVNNLSRNVISKLMIRWGSENILANRSSPLKIYGLQKKKEMMLYSVVYRVRI